MHKALKIAAAVLAALAAGTSTAQGVSSEEALDFWRNTRWREGVLMMAYSSAVDCTRAGGSARILERGMAGWNDWSAKAALQDPLWGKLSQYESFTRLSVVECRNSGKAVHASVHWGYAGINDRAPGHLRTWIPGEKVEGVSAGCTAYPNCKMGEEK